jgi:hypothetical protein
MKRSMLLIIIICTVALLIPAASWAHGRAPVPLGEGKGVPDGDGPTPTPQVQLDGVITVLQGGDVHPYPTADAPPIGTVRPGDVVRVSEYVGAWARIAVEERALGGPVIPLTDGWVDGTVLDAPAPSVPALPSAAPTTPGSPLTAAGGTSNTVPVPNAPAPQPTAVTPAAGGTVTDAAVPLVRVRALPAERRSTTPSQPVIPIPITVPICYDRNANKFCDIDEGVAGLTVYVTDSGGQILGQTLTDATGVAQFTIRAPATAQLAISVPYFGASQSVPATNPRTQPIRIAALTALPALVP